MDRQSAFRRFIETEQRHAVTLAWRLLGRDMAQAEDVAQRAFLKAWGGLHKFRDDAQIRTWFHRILINEVRSYQRWRLIRRRLWAPASAADRIGKEAAEGDFALRERINSAVAMLTPAQREVFVLVRLQGLTIHEAATIIGRAQGTIKSHLHRALEHLRTELADLHEDAV